MWASYCLYQLFWDHWDEGSQRHQLRTLVKFSAKPVEVALISTPIKASTSLIQAMLQIWTFKIYEYFLLSYCCCFDLLKNIFGSAIIEDFVEYVLCKNEANSIIYTP